MSTTWITALKRTGGSYHGAAAWLESVADQAPRIGTPGCTLATGNGPGKHDCTNTYATVKAALPASFTEFDGIEAIEAGKPSAVRASTFKVSVNAALVREVKPGPAGWSALIFTSGNEIIVSGDAPAVSATLAAV